MFEYPWIYLLFGAIALVVAILFNKKAFAIGAGGSGATQAPTGSVPAPSWDDIAIPGVALGRGASAPDLKDFGSGHSVLPSGLKTRAFSDSGPAEEMFGELEITHSYEEGTDIYPHVHWSPGNAAPGDVKWFIEYTVCNVGEVFPPNSTVTVVTSTNEAAWDNIISELSPISGDGLKIGSQLVFRIYRDPSDASDTYEGDAHLLTIGFHFRQSTVGSSGITTK